MNTNMNSNTSFGMAFKLPVGNCANGKMAEQLNLNTSLKKRGFKQFVEEQSKLIHYHTQYDTEKKTINILDNFDNVHDTYPSEKFGSAYSDGWVSNGKIRRFIDKIINPKLFINTGFYKAGEKAKELEAKVIAKEKAFKNMMDVIKN